MGSLWMEWAFPQTELISLLPGCSCQCFEQNALSEPEGWSGLLHSAFGLRLGRSLWRNSVLRKFWQCLEKQQEPSAIAPGTRALLSACCSCRLGPLSLPAKCWWKVRAGNGKISLVQNFETWFLIRQLVIEVEAW